MMFEPKKEGASVFSLIVSTLFVVMMFDSVELFGQISLEDALPPPQYKEPAINDVTNEDDSSAVSANRCQVLFLFDCPGVLHVDLKKVFELDSLSEVKSWIGYFEPGDHYAYMFFRGAKFDTSFSILPSDEVHIIEVRLKEQYRLIQNETGNRNLSQRADGYLIDSRDGLKYGWKRMKDGNIWMIDNLNFETRGSYCYDNSGRLCDAYGRLYEWHAARYACPVGWHLPTKQEWIALFEAYGGKETAGEQLKSFYYWNNSLSVESNNASGFSARPGGMRSGRDGSFTGCGIEGNWWSSTEIIELPHDPDVNVWFWYMRYDRGEVLTSGDLSTLGQSVRCIRD